MITPQKKVIVALSGGVDSSLSVALLIKNGFYVSSLSFSVFNETKTESISLHEKIKKISTTLGIENEFINIEEVFKKEIICNFIEEYINGHTPNPCVLCNKKIKFKILYEKAIKENYDFIATGHYAQVKNNGNRFFIQKHQDIKKDQSYMLWMLPQEYLSKTMFPLATIKTKEETRCLAHEYGIANVVIKEESQDICFLPNNNYKSFIKEEIKQEIKKGDIIFENKIIGQHNGYPFYTIGQRNGLGVAIGCPLFVKEINPAQNQIVVCKEEDLYGKEMEIKDFVLQKYENIIHGQECVVKVRYHDAGHKATIHKTNNNNILKIKFEEPVKAITKGQSAVMYEGDDVIGGGIIK